MRPQAPNLAVFEGIFLMVCHFLPEGLCPPACLPPCALHSMGLPGLVCAGLQGDTDLAVATDALSCVLRAPHYTLQGPIGWD